MPLPVSQRNFSSDCLRTSPHRTVSSRIPLRQAPGISPCHFLHRGVLFRILFRTTSCCGLLHPWRCLAWCSASFSLLPFDGPKAILLYSAMPVVSCLRKPCAPLIYMVRARVRTYYIWADGNQKAAASLVPCGEREAGGGLVGRDGSRVWDGGQICHHFFLGFSGTMLYSSRMMSS